MSYSKIPPTPYSFASSPLSYFCIIASCISEGKAENLAKLKGYSLKISFHKSLSNSFTNLAHSAEVLLASKSKLAANSIYAFTLLCSAVEFNKSIMA